jgi:hypothetical protein
VTRTFLNEAQHKCLERPGRDPCGTEIFLFILPCMDFYFLFDMGVGMNDLKTMS